MYENNKFRSYRKDQHGNEYRLCTISRCAARLKMSDGIELVELTSNNHTYANTVDNEIVPALRIARKRKGRRLKLV